MVKIKPIVAIIMGSQSDWVTMRHAKETLDSLGIECEAKVISAHRTPDRLTKFATSAQKEGFKVIICGAGMAAALPGVTAAHTSIPVLGVPIEGKLMGGLDAILSMVQMPAGIPVGTLALGRSGAINAAILAASILGISDSKIADALKRYRERQTASIIEEPKDPD